VTKPIINHRNIFYPPGGILIWIIIFLELITFGAALIVMAVFRNEEPIIFHNSRLELNTSIGMINTLLLITSGFFMAVSVMYFKKQNLNKSKLYLKLTMLGGILFLLLKSIEYYHKVEAGFTMGYNTFFSFYWMLTLFHVIHVIVGIIILLSVHRMFQKEKLDSNLDDIEASAAFWHMCDLIWLLLFPVIYLIF